MRDTPPKSDRDLALTLIRTALIEKKLTQAELADAADCHEKTIQNLLGGRSVRDQTLFDVCMVLGLDFQRVKEAWNGGSLPSGPMELKGDGGHVAPVYMGAYTRAAVDHYIGNYITVRPAFATPGMIVAYRTAITWDPEWPSLLFEEHNRPDAAFAHRGRLYVPASSFIYLVSLTKGAMRMVCVSQLDQAGMMRGLIATLNKRRAMFVPVAAPIVYIKADSPESRDLGEITEGHRAYRRYQTMLSETTSLGYATLAEA
jgi:DNA-binding XRE family transcriptional regulator